jgi:subtilisin family serine protease
MASLPPQVVYIYPPPPPPPGPNRGLGIALMIITGLWTVGLTVVGHFVGWFVGEALTELEQPVPGWVWLLAAWVPALLAALPAVLLGTLSRLDFVRWTGRGWAFAALAGGLLGTARLIPLPFHEVYLAVLALVAAGAAILGPAGPRADPPGPPIGRTWLALISLAAGLACLLPWLWLGALGGTLETVCAAAAALAVGWLASRRLSGLFAVGAGIRNRWGRTAVTGLVVGVGFTALLAGVGAPGINVLALVALPALGFVAAALYRPSLVALLGVAVFGPLAFVDPEETTLLLGFEDVAYWAVVSAAVTLGVVVLLAIPYTAIFGGRRIELHRWLAAAVAGAVALGAVVVYAVPGQPGLHGEKVFVVMKQQADLGGLSAIGDRDERLRQTYRRLVDTAEQSQASIRGQLRDWGVSFRPYYLVNGLEVDGGQLVRAWLRQRADVDRVLLNPQLRPLPTEASVLRGNEPAPTEPQWNLTSIGANRVWDELDHTGEGIVVGGSDSGVDGAHPALRGNFRGGADSWLDPFATGAAATTPTDHNGHGTHTLASAVGVGVGVAPGAQWMGCVNLPRNFGNPADYLTCLQFMLAPYAPGGDPLRDGRPERAPHVLTNSWGCPQLEGCDAGALRQAVAALSAAGLYFVAAAGNNGPDCGTIDDPPALYPDALTVGAVDEEGALTDFSSRGPVPGGLAKPDLVAPGAQILSALPGGGYGELNGTSMATPHVAGVVALMWSANPKLIGDIARTTDILRRTASPARVTGPACGGTGVTIGAGEVNAFAAVEAAKATS